MSEIYTKPNIHFINFIKKNISKEAVKKNRIDKKHIADIIFNNEEAKTKLEKYIHKKTQLSRNRFIKKNLKIKKKAIFVDIPLLLENNLEKEFDLVVSVISSKEIRLKRLLKNKKFKKETIKKIFNLQTTDKERRKRSQITINNNKSKKDFIFSAKKALIEFLK